MPIKITSRFATVRDTARVLGVSKRRTNELIEMVERSLNRPTSAHRTTRAGNGRSAALVSSKRKASGGTDRKSVV